MIYQNKNLMTRITAIIVIMGFIVTQTGLGTAFALRPQAEAEAAGRTGGQDPIATELMRAAGNFVKPVKAVVSDTATPAAGAAETTARGTGISEADVNQLTGVMQQLLQRINASGRKLVNNRICISKDGKISYSFEDEFDMENSEEVTLPVSIINTLQRLRLNGIYIDIRLLSEMFIENFKEALLNFDNMFNEFADKEKVERSGVALIKLGTVWSVSSGTKITSVMLEPAQAAGAAIREDMTPDDVLRLIGLLGFHPRLGVMAGPDETITAYKVVAKLQHDYYYNDKKMEFDKPFDENISFKRAQEIIEPILLSLSNERYLEWALGVIDYERPLTRVYQLTRKGAARITEIQQQRSAATPAAGAANSVGQQLSFEDQVRVAEQFLADHGLPVNLLSVNNETEEFSINLYNTSVDDISALLNLSRLWQLNLIGTKVPQGVIDDFLVNCASQRITIYKGRSILTKPIGSRVATPAAGKIDNATIMNALKLARSGNYLAALNSIVGGSLTSTVWEKIKFEQSFRDAEGEPLSGGILALLNFYLPEGEQFTSETLSDNLNVELSELDIDSLALVEIIMEIESFMEMSGEEQIPDDIAATVKTVGDVFLWTAIAYRAKQEGFNLYSIDVAKAPAAGAAIRANMNPNDVLGLIALSGMNIDENITATAIVVRVVTSYKDMGFKRPFNRGSKAEEIIKSNLELLRQDGDLKLISAGLMYGPSRLDRSAPATSNPRYELTEQGKTKIAAIQSQLSAAAQAIGFKPYSVEYFRDDDPAFYDEFENLWYVDLDSREATEAVRDLGGLYKILAFPPSLIKNILMLVYQPGRLIERTNVLERLEILRGISIKILDNVRDQRVNLYTIFETPKNVEILFGANIQSQDFDQMIALSRSTSAADYKRLAEEAYAAAQAAGAAIKRDMTPDDVFMLIAHSNIRTDEPISASLIDNFYYFNYEKMGFSSFAEEGMDPVYILNMLNSNLDKLVESGLLQKVAGRFFFTGEGKKRIYEIRQSIEFPAGQQIPINSRAILAIIALSPELQAKIQTNTYVTRREIFDSYDLVVQRYPAMSWPESIRDIEWLVDNNFIRKITSDDLISVSLFIPSDNVNDTYIQLTERGNKEVASIKSEATAQAVGVDEKGLLYDNLIRKLLEHYPGLKQLTIVYADKQKPFSLPFAKGRDPKAAIEASIREVVPGPSPGWNYFNLTINEEGEATVTTAISPKGDVLKAANKRAKAATPAAGAAQAIGFDVPKWLDEMPDKRYRDSLIGRLNELFRLDPRLLELENRYGLLEKQKHWVNTDNWRDVSPSGFAISVTSEYARSVSNLNIYDLLIKEGLLNPEDKSIADLGCEYWSYAYVFPYAFPELRNIFGVEPSSGKVNGYRRITVPTYGLDSRFSIVQDSIANLKSNQILQEHVGNNGKFDVVFLQNPLVDFSTEEYNRFLRDVADTLKESGKLVVVIDNIQLPYDGNPQLMQSLKTINTTQLNDIRFINDRSSSTLDPRKVSIYVITQPELMKLLPASAQAAGAVNTAVAKGTGIISLEDAQQVVLDLRAIVQSNPDIKHLWITRDGYVYDKADYGQRTIDNRQVPQNFMNCIYKYGLDGIRFSLKGVLNEKELAEVLRHIDERLEFKKPVYFNLVDPFQSSSGLQKGNILLSIDGLSENRDIEQILFTTAPAPAAGMNVLLIGDARDLEALVASRAEFYTVNIKIDALQEATEEQIKTYDLVIRKTGTVYELLKNAGAISITCNTFSELELTIDKEMYSWA